MVMFTAESSIVLHNEVGAIVVYGLLKMTAYGV